MLNNMFGDHIRNFLCRDCLSSPTISLNGRHHLGFAKSTIQNTVQTESSFVNTEKEIMGMKTWVLKKYSNKIFPKVSLQQLGCHLFEKLFSAGWQGLPLYVCSKVVS
jgi:hypothetical protein